MSYISLHKTQLLDTLESQVLYSDLSSVVIADKGMGKSFFLQQLHSRLEQQVYISQIEAGISLSCEQIDKSICLQLGLSWQASEQTLLEKIEQSLDQRILLTIDDAHLLSKECLNFLLSIAHPQQTNTDKKIYLVLTGEPSLANTLNQTSLLKRTPSLCVVFELQALELDEIKPMIADFESIKLSKAESLFDQQRLDYFWQLSKGNAAELKKQLTRWQVETDSLTNKISTRDKSADKPAKNSNANLTNSLLVPKNITHPLVEDVNTDKKRNNIWLIVGYSFIALLLLLALIYQDAINQQIMPNKNEASVSPPVLIESLKQKTQSQQPKAEDTKQKAKTVESKREVINSALKAKNSANETNNKNTTAQQQLAAQSLTNDEAVASEPKVDEKLLAKKSNQLSDGYSVDNKVADNKTSENKQQLQTELAPILNEQKQSTKLSADEQLLLKQAADKFTLQWLVVSNFKSAQSFIVKHPLKNDMRIFRRKQKQTYLFIVVSGQYNSHTDADNARATYILQGYQGKPWIKAISAIISDIKQLN